MIDRSPVHHSSPCIVTTRRGTQCGVLSVQDHPSHGHICALHLFHFRRSRSARPNLQVRVSSDDLAALDRLASDHNLSRSEAFRRVLKNLPLPRSFADIKTYRELRHIGVNVNQIAHSLNRGDDLSWEEISGYLEHLHDRLDFLALRLCGEIEPDPDGDS